MFGAYGTYDFALQISLVLVVLVFTSHVTFAQIEEDIPEGVVPPPLSFVSKDEKRLLAAEKKSKGRTKVSLALMNTRIAKAESSSDKSEYQESLNELGNFRALMNDALGHLRQNSGRKGISRNVKRFEIGLRGFIPRLESLRRSLPFSHSYHVSKLIKSVRDARKEAIDSFFGDTVLPSPSE